MRKRRRRENPDVEIVELAGTLASGLATIFWTPRAGGLIGGGTALYSAMQGHRTRAIVGGVLSGLIFFSPEIGDLLDPPAAASQKKTLGAPVKQKVVRPRVVE